MEPALFIVLFRPAAAPIPGWVGYAGPALRELGTLGCPDCKEPGCGAAGTLSLLGKGLFRGSTLSCVVEDVGVPWAELAGDCDEPPSEGDAVPEPPEAESFFFDEDLLDSFARESCSCYSRQQIRTN